MNYFLLADMLWYLGHIMTGSSILFSRTNYYVAIYLVFIGQFITIISRPIGRIKNDTRVEHNSKVNMMLV
jgi:hypothetical protein